MSGKSCSEVENIENMVTSASPSSERIDDMAAYSGERLRKIEKKWYHHLNKLLPTKNRTNLLLTQCLFLFFFCYFLFGLLYEDAKPGTEVFAIILMGFLSLIGGKIFSMAKLPSLLGMMIVGFILKNVDFITFYEDISQKTISIIRYIALSFILLRAGLEINGSILMEMKMTVLRLTIVPCLAETLSIGIFSRFLLDLPWTFSLMLGFIVSAISPEVVLPILINLEHRGYGVKKGIPTLIMAASTLDDVLAIAGFTMCFSMATSKSQLAWTIIKGPLEPLMGFAFGCVYGIIFWLFPSSDRKVATLVLYNVLLMSFSGMSLMFLCKIMGLPGAGPVGCLILSFVAAIAWRKNPRQFAGVHDTTAMIWEIIQPFLFATIGAEVTIKTLQNTAGYGVLCLLLGLICRSSITALVCAGANMNCKEKLFVCCAWLPKATVQAAIGSQILDYARENNMDEELVRKGTIVLNISVLSIFLTAPLGAALTSMLGPYLLSRDVIGYDSDEDEPREVVRFTESLHQELEPSNSIVVTPSKASLIPKI